MEFLLPFASSENLEILTKLIVALVFGAVLGLERVFARRTAGVRTYALVSMGSALFVLIGELVTRGYLEQSLPTDVDSLRIASNIVVGVGFLGAGVIVFKDSALSGLTTAAGLWVSAAIGVAVGFGHYAAGFIATLLTLFIFTVLWYVEFGLLKFHDTTKDFER